MPQTRTAYAAQARAVNRDDRTIDVIASTDTLDARAAWLYVAIVGTGYIVSRGLAKAGSYHEPTTRGRGR